ncbi:MAG: hypothetical protein V7644_2630 [Actinomycetota bacterium]
MAVEQETAGLPVPLAARVAGRSPWLVSLAVCGLTFWLAYDQGSYDVPSRNAVAVVVWWSVIVAAAAGLAVRSRAATGAVATAGALAALALWTLASTVWAPSAEDAFSEFDRVALYLGVFVLVCLLVRRSHVEAWCSGLGVGILAVAVVALGSRLYPGAFPKQAGISILPPLVARLSYPLGYWNGLGILCALGIPLLVACAATGSRAAARGAYAGGVPLLCATIYLTSSRGAFASAACAVAAFVILTGRRWRALGLTLLALAGGGVSVALLAHNPAVANGGISSADTTVALALAGIALLTGAACGALLVVPAPRRPPPPVVGWGLAAAVVVAVLLAVAVAHPASRLHAFERPPTALATPHGDYVKAHLLSGSGSGRWQFWQAAVAEFRSSRVHGRGAGSFAEWWAAHGTLATSIQDAHSLYLETLGELGLVGLLLLLGPFALAAVAGVRRLRHLSGSERTVAAGAAAAVCGYLVAAGVDWMWELTAVSVVAFAALALLVAPAVGGPALRTLRGPGAPRRSRRTPVLAVAVLAAWLAACAEALPLLTQLQIGASQAAARGGRTAAAVSDARSAVRLQPWASSPYLQLALVSEASGNLPAAQAAIGRAIHRDPSSWSVWLVAARIATKQGDLAAARRGLARAKSLNPRSPLFAGGRD